MNAVSKTASAIAPIVLLFAVGGAVAVDIPPLPALKTFHTEVSIVRDSKPVCSIVIPSGPAYAQLGRSLAEAIRATSGADVPVKDAAAVPVEALTSSNLILLGYFGNNPLIERLYDEFYVNLSADWPGKGGYTIRTVHDPLGSATNFVVIGGAETGSVGKATEDFIATLPQAQTDELAYAHTAKVVTPDGSVPYKLNPGGVAARIEAARGKNFRAVAGLLVKAGFGYYRTGNPNDVDVFGGLVPILLDVIRKLDKIDDMRGAIELINVWDAIEEAPGFSPANRADITAFMWEFTHRFTYCGRVAEDAATPAGNNWNSRVACDLGRYWKKYYNIDAGGLWTWADVNFRSKAKFWRSKEDCPGYGGHTMYDTVYYVLSHQHADFWESGNGRKMADYGMAVINNLGGMAGFGDTSAMGASGDWPALLRVAAWKLKDGRYLYAHDHANPGGAHCFFHNTYAQNEVKPTKPDVMGVHVVPLPDWVYEHRGKVLGTAPEQMNPVLDQDPTPPREECFDKITFRTSMDREDQYLILGGISHGYHAHPDGNAIIELTDKGRYCLFDSGYFVPDTIEHTTLIVYRDGLFEPIPRLTGLSALGDFLDLGMTQTYLNGYNGVNWRRNIIWRKGDYFLVLDEVEALDAGRYGLNAVFRTLSDEKLDVGSDRVVSAHRGVPFSIISAGSARFKTTSTTPFSGERHAVIECKDAQLQPGDREYFINLLSTPNGQGEWAHEVVPAGNGAVMIKSANGYALAGVGKRRPVPGVAVDAALFYATECDFTLTAGRTFTAGATWFAADRPVNVQVRIGPEAEAIIESKGTTVVRLHAKNSPVKLNGKEVNVSAGPAGVKLELGPGKHTVSFTPRTAKIDLGDLRDIYDGLKRKHDAELASRAEERTNDKQMQPAWRVETATTEPRAFYVNADGAEVRSLALKGKPKCWTEAQRGANPRSAVDGSPETYTATSSGLAWTADLPKDIGVEWSRPVSVGCFQIDYYNAAYAPTVAGQQLQSWDGEGWNTIEAEISKDDSTANWTYVFTPIQTTRIRVFITEFTQSRTAVREMRVFAEPAMPRQQDLRIPKPTHGLKALDVDGDGRDEVLAAVGNRVKCIDGDGHVRWEQELPAAALCVDAYDLNNDGKGEVVVGGKDHKLYCFNHAGDELWVVETPADPFTPDREPMQGEVKVVRCADIDGDGDGEIVLGSSNWFAYAYDHQGKLLWTALNWAHQPTSIAFASLGNDRLAALIGTTYCAANVFDPDGKAVRSLSVGYHGAAMSTAAGDMDGNGQPELIAGSRVGGLHCEELGTDKSWTRFMGAEVGCLALADLNGDGKLELIAGSKNFHLLVTDAEGVVLWSLNVGDAILDLAVADVNADGALEIVVATEGGMIRGVSSNGEVLSTFRTGGNVTKVAVGDLAGDGRMRIVAGCDDGFVYGAIE